MKVVFAFDGRAEAHGSGLLCHNERLSDPLDPAARSVGEIASKRNKTEADHLELARREFLGSLYTNGNGPCIPAWNLIRCLQDGARQLRLGKQVVRGVHPLVEYTDLLYDGPRDPDELWKDGNFMLRKGVGVGGKKVMRTRPLFREWKCDLVCEVDPSVFDLHTLQEIADLAGTYHGLGDGRPIFGRAKITVIAASEWLRLGKGAVDAVWDANRSSIERILEEDGEREDRHTVTTKKK